MSSKVCCRVTQIKDVTHSVLILISTATASDVRMRKHTCNSHMSVTEQQMLSQKHVL